ncbi:hypothetical protein Tco_1051379 [Tanacetum coccineum]
MIALVKVRWDSKRGPELTWERKDQMRSRELKRNGNVMVVNSGYQQKDRKPSQNDKTEHGMEKTVQNQGQSPKMPKVRVNTENQQVNGSRNENYY